MGERREGGFFFFDIMFGQNTNGRWNTGAEIRSTIVTNFPPTTIRRFTCLSHLRIKRAQVPCSSNSLRASGKGISVPHVTPWLNLTVPPLSARLRALNSSRFTLHHFLLEFLEVMVANLPVEPQFTKNVKVCVHILVYLEIKGATEEIKSWIWPRLRGDEKPSSCWHVRILIHVIHGRAVWSGPISVLLLQLGTNNSGEFILFNETNLVEFELNPLSRCRLGFLRCEGWG